jgi:hypothetical protein
MHKIVVRFKIICLKSLNSYMFRTVLVGPSSGTALNAAVQQYCVILHTNCYLAHQLLPCTPLSCTPTDILHTNCYLAHQLLSCTPNVILHTNWYLAHQLLSCTPTVILHTNWYLAHQLLSCTPTVLVLHNCLNVLGAFAELRKATISFVMSVRPSAWNNLAPTGQIFMKFGIWLFF